jgi:hypothetical protein
MATLNLAAAAISKGRKQEGQNFGRSKKIRQCRNDDRSDQNDERAAENANHAETYA